MLVYLVYVKDKPHNRKISHLKNWSLLICICLSKLELCTMLVRVKKFNLYKPNNLYIYIICVYIVTYIAYKYVLYNIYKHVIEHVFIFFIHSFYAMEATKTK